MAVLPDPGDGLPYDQSTLYGGSFAWIGRHLHWFGHGGYTNRPVGLQPLGGSERFVDKVYDFATFDPWYERWEYVERSISAASFPWNLSPDTPLISRVGSAASPRAFTIGDETYMPVTASVQDAYLITGEHVGTPDPTPYGSRTDPWSYFRVFLFRLTATAPGVTEWRLVNRGRKSDNIGVSASFFGHTPTVAQQSGNYKGVIGIHSAIQRDGYLYMWCEMFRTSGWKGQGGQTQFVVRTKDLQITQVWNGSWWSMPQDGELPSITNAEDTSTGPSDTDHWHAPNPFALIASSVDEQHVAPGSSYILLSSPERSYAYCALSDDSGEPLTRWRRTDEIGGRVQSDVAGIADGTPDSCINPAYVEINGEPHLSFSVRPQGTVGDQYNGFVPWIARCAWDGLGAVVVTPPPPPPPPPVATTLPYPYDIPQPGQAKTISVAMGYAVDDAVFVSTSGNWWLVRFGGTNPLSAPPDGGTWQRGEVL